MRPTRDIYAKIHEPPTPFVALIAPSLGWGLVWSILATLCLGTANFVWTLAHDSYFDLRWLLPVAGVVNLVLFVTLTVGRLVWRSRVIQDKAFTVLGFCATFFGLAMLVVFFTVMFQEVAEWFHYTPLIIAHNNRHLEILQKQVNDAESYKTKVVADLRQKMLELMEDEETAEDKEKVRLKFETKIIPYSVKEQDEIIAQKKTEIEKGLRPENNAWSNLIHFLTHGPSKVSDPQDAGIYPALLGSLWLACITMALAVPIGVGAAIYLEEYKTGGKLGALIQLNINNLAGVPSVVYGILGAGVFVPIFQQLKSAHSDIEPRNVLGGGMTLALLTLPVVIVAAQEAIRAVPSSIRQGALALGATKWQTIWHQVLPMASPGIFTGTILALSRAIGEAAPLVLFGALLFVHSDTGPFSPFTVMPMQIFGWADRPALTFPVGENGAPVSLDMWRFNAALACVVLMAILLTLNGATILLRNRAQKRLRS